MQIPGEGTNHSSDYSPFQKKYDETEIKNSLYITLHSLDPKLVKMTVQFSANPTYSTF
jgi:hypothetical protein